MRPALTIRRASPDEIDEAIAIDDDACSLFDTIGLRFDFGADHPFARAEHARWLAAAHQGHMHLAVDASGRAVGLLVLSFVDEEPHLEQLSVRTSAMRQGIGRLLLRHAIDWAAGHPLWLTTYAHVPWNRAFYEQEGFAVVPISRCPASIVDILDEQRRVLPAPEQRIAMRRATG